MATVCAGLAAFSGATAAKRKPKTATLAAASSAAIIAQAVFYLRTTRRGKFEVWAKILREMGLEGDETLLDLGCGRGAVLLTAARLLPRGRAIGVDVWRQDQIGNSPQQTLTNAELENVAGRVEVFTANITDLPFDDDSVDVIVSSLVIHNIPGTPGREQACPRGGSRAASGRAPRDRGPARHPQTRGPAAPPGVAGAPPQPGLADVVGRSVGPDALDHRDEANRAVEAHQAGRSSPSRAKPTA